MNEQISYDIDLIFKEIKAIEEFAMKLKEAATAYESGYITEQEFIAQTGYINTQFQRGIVDGNK
jgi:hypothetical protein